MKKIGNVLWGIVLVLVGVIIALNRLELTNINLFFKGWWTLFIIVPNAIGIVKNNNKMWNVIWLLVGIVLLLSVRDIISFSAIRKLILPVILVVIGLNIIFKDVINSSLNKKIKELNKNNADEYYATFSGQNLVFNNEAFNGGNLNAIFGGIDLDITNAIIDSDKVIETNAVFGGIDIKVPSNVNVKVKSTSLFGGVDNKVKKYTQDAPTIYVKAFCLFGGVDIK